MTKLKTSETKVISDFKWACPIYYNIPTKMLKSSFENTCKITRENILSDISKPGTVTYKHIVNSCDSCEYGEQVIAGTLVDPPPKMEWITISEYYKNKEKEPKEPKEKVQAWPSSREIVIRPLPEKVCSVPEVFLSDAEGKLTADKVRKIRKLHATKTYTHAELGVLFGTSRRNIGKIISRETWRSVE